MSLTWRGHWLPWEDLLWTKRKPINTPFKQSDDTDHTDIFVCVCVWDFWALHVLYLARSNVSCDMSDRSENPEIGSCKNHLPSFDVKKKFGLRKVLLVEKWSKVRQLYSAITAQGRVCLYMGFLLIFIFVQSHESSRGYVTVLWPNRVHIPPHGKWRFGIEAKRLIALATSIRIHLKTGLETKWWFLNFEDDLDIWVSKQSYPLGAGRYIVCVCVSAHVLQ